MFNFNLGIAENLLIMLRIVITSSGDIMLVGLYVYAARDDDINVNVLIVVLNIHKFWFRL